jgi:PBSX family phage terminase large subunit
VSAAVAVERRVDLFPRQMRFVKSRAKFPAYIGGIGSGKSFAGAAKVLTRIGEPGVGMICAPTYSMLRDATRRSLLELLQQLDIPHTLHKSENTITILNSGHEILCRSLDNPNALRGPNLEWCWPDESGYITREAWNVIIGRVRVGPLPQIWPTSSPKGRNWMWELWERDATGNEFDPTHPLFRARTRDNPELPADFADSLGYSGRFAAQELDGEFVAFDGLVYNMFSRPRHVTPMDCEGWRTSMTVDIGSRNPTAILTVRSAGDERVHIERETYRRNMSSGDITDAIKAEADRCNPDVIYVDPSAKGYILELQRAGYPVKAANNDVIEGIGRVTDVLEHGFTIDPSCVNTIAEFESYRYPEGSRSETDKPLKENDHALDAFRYFCLGEAVPPQKVMVW